MGERLIIVDVCLVFDGCSLQRYLEVGSRLDSLNVQPGQVARFIYLSNGGNTLCKHPFVNVYTENIFDQDQQAGIAKIIFPSKSVATSCFWARQRVPRRKLAPGAFADVVFHAKIWSLMSVGIPENLWGRRQIDC